MSAPEVVAAAFEGLEAKVKEMVKVIEAQRQSLHLYAMENQALRAELGQLRRRVREALEGELE